MTHSKSTTEEITTESKLSFESIAVLVSLTLYLLINFLPKGFSYDISGVQWLGISAVNLIVGLLIFSSKKDITDWKTIKVTPVLLIFTLFIVLSGVSIYAGENQTEGFATLIRMLNTFIPLFYFKTLSNKPFDLLKTFSIIVTIILFIECLNVLIDFLDDKIDDFIALAGTGGNINIFASNIILKLPFVIYAFFSIKSLKKYIILIPVILAIALLFLTSSRTNVVNLSFMAVALLLFLIINKKLKENLLNVSIILVVIGIGFGFSLLKPSAVGNGAKSDLKVIQNNPTFNKFNNLTGNRLNLWNNSYILMKRKPLTGIGLGNYKIEAIPLESKTRAYWGISKYSHNDFIQVAAESGVFTGILYISIFVIIFFLSAKAILNKENSETQKWIAFIVFVSIVCFAFDSLFNFPLQRPITQIHFLIILFLFFQLSNKNSKALFSLNSTVPFILLFALNLFVMKYNNDYHKSLVGQNTVMADEKDLKLTFAQVDEALPEYPNLMEKGYAVGTTKSRYLVKEEKYDEAIKLLNASKKVNKHYQFTESVLAEIYAKLGQKDSVQKYWKSCFEMFPHYKAFYINNLVTMRAANNQAEINKAIAYAKKFNGTKEFAQIGYNIDNNLPLNYDSSKAKNQPNKVNTVNNNNVAINNEIKKYTDELNKVNKQNWPELLRINTKLNQLAPNHPPYLLNIGMSYFKLNKQSKAKPFLEKVIASNFFKDGLPEFVLGVNYLTTNDKVNACKYISIAKSKNYVVPDNIAANCK